MKRILLILACTCCCLSYLRAADSVDVTFRYTKLGATNVSVPGTFNGWNNTAWPMMNGGSGLWLRTARLPIGTQQYKFYYSGVTTWPNDPLNHHVNSADNDNSLLFVKDPTIYQFLPNQRNPLVSTNTPSISAYIYSKVGSTLDTSTLSLSIDGTLYTGIGTAYNFISQQLTFVSPPLPNGSHTVILRAGTNADTVTFATQGGFVRFLNQFPFTTWKSNWTLNGIVDDTSVTMARVVRNGIDTFDVAVSGKSFSATVPLVEGTNSFVALAESSGTLMVSSPAIFNRQINHSPSARIEIFRGGDYFSMTADSSTDPDPGQSDSLTFYWTQDSTNPFLLGGLDGSTGRSISFARPAETGEYYYNLIATDPDGNRDTTRRYFTLYPDHTSTVSTIASNPAWAKNARVYFLFPKAASVAGTLNAAAQRLPSIKILGFNVVWLMPVMTNAYPINNGPGPGYNIVDFYSVAPEYGTNQDFKNFVSQAHALGLKVILDVTPNHTSRYHSWSMNAHTFKENSPYWNWYQHQSIAHNENGLGQSADPDGFWYYSAFSDQLLNFNWMDVDAQHEMINVYKHWITEFDLDGYRFDVYWGPHRRYGEQYMGNPVRAALKHIKPNILLLAEDDGTGLGTETIYADRMTNGITGGVDAAYDFKLYQNQIKYFGFGPTAVTNLHTEIDNAGFYPGVNSLYMRFMESQDEDRIVYFYSNQFNLDATTTFKRTMPVASVLFTAPGFPMIWNGQEVGWGYGITAGTHARSRSVIDWNYQGQPLLSPHYQKLAHIRGQFPAFVQHKQDTNLDGVIDGSDVSDFVRVAAPGSSYAFIRPYRDQNGLTVVNFAPTVQSMTLDLRSVGSLLFTGGIQDSTWYYLNDLYGNGRRQIQGAGLSSVDLTLPAFGTGIYTVSTTPDSVAITNPIVSVRDRSTELSIEFSLDQNYPNPFNPSTQFRFSVNSFGPVNLKVYDMLGQEVATVLDEVLPPGSYIRQWDAGGVASGVYFYRLVSGEHSSAKKLLLMR